MQYPASDLVIDPLLIRKYDVSGPRYTSYPTADRFVDAFGDAQARSTFVPQAERLKDLPDDDRRAFLENAAQAFDAAIAPAKHTTKPRTVVTARSQVIKNPPIDNA